MSQAYSTPEEIERAQAFMDLMLAFTLSGHQRPYVSAAIDTKTGTSVTFSTAYVGAQTGRHCTYDSVVSWLRNGRFSVGQLQGFSLDQAANLTAATAYANLIQTVASFCIFATAWDCNRK